MNFSWSDSLPPEARTRFCAFSPAASGPTGSGAAAAPPPAAGAGDALRRLGDLHTGDEPFEVAFLFGVEIAGLLRGGGFEVGLAHSAGTRVGAVSGAGAAAAGLVGDIEREPREDEAADEIAERDRNLIPQPPLARR